MSVSWLEIPEVALVALIGGPRALRAGFLEAWFDRDEIVPSGAPDLIARVETRLEARALTVVDVGSLSRETRAQLVGAAKRWHTLRRAIVLDVPDEEGHRPPTAKGMREQGFRDAVVLGSVDEIESAVVERARLESDLRHEPGPFDLIGDVHGCERELRTLLERLGYAPDDEGVHRHPEGRRVIFLGDLVDRGPSVTGVLSLAMSMVERGAAFCVMGNHEAKLLRWLRGKDIQRTHGTLASIEQLEREPEAFRESLRAFIESLPSHLCLDGGQLVAAHAGLKEELQGRSGGKVRAFALYGDTTGETDDRGYPVRLDWAQHYRGEATVVYGHTPLPEARWVNRTICLDTACVFGGELTALRWPERELVAVPAEAVHYRPSR